MNGGFLLELEAEWGSRGTAMQRQLRCWWSRAWGLCVLQLYFCPLIHLVFLRLWQLFGG